MRLFSILSTLMAFLLTVRDARAGAGDEILSVTEGVKPNVLFLIDLSSSMADPCNSSQTESCLATVIKVIDAMSQHYDWARYGVIGTGTQTTHHNFQKIVPLGSSHAELSAALSSISTMSNEANNPSEALAKAMLNYFSLAIPANDDDDDGDGFQQDWLEGPIQYSCQKNHVNTMVHSMSGALHNFGATPKSEY